MIHGGLIAHKDENGVVSVFALYHPMCNRYKHVEMLRDGAWTQVGLARPDIKRMCAHA